MMRTNLSRIGSMTTDSPLGAANRLPLQALNHTGDAPHRESFPHLIALWRGLSRLEVKTMAQTYTGALKPLSGTCYSSDNELMSEIVEVVTESVGDVRFDSGVVDHIRHQASVKLEDGRILRITFMFE
jgi:hypothetical protein